MLVASDALVAGEMRVVRLESALGPCVQGLHEKRKKVPHPGLQHVPCFFWFLCGGIVQLFTYAGPGAQKRDTPTETHATHGLKRSPDAARRAIETPSADRIKP